MKFEVELSVSESVCDFKVHTAYPPKNNNVMQCMEFSLTPKPLCLAVLSPVSPHVSCVDLLIMCKID